MKNSFKKDDKVSLEMHELYALVATGIAQFLDISHKGKLSHTEIQQQILDYQEWIGKSIVLSLNHIEELHSEDKKGELH